MIGRTSAPIHFCPTKEAAAAFGPHLPRIAREAFIEIGRLARGYAIHHHQFRSSVGALVAVASRVKQSGIVEIEIDLGNPNIPFRSFTVEDAAKARHSSERRAVRGTRAR